MELIRGGDLARGSSGGGRAGTDKREYFIEAAAISLPRPVASQILSIPVDAGSCKWRKNRLMGCLSLTQVGGCREAEKRR